MTGRADWQALGRILPSQMKRLQRDLIVETTGQGSSEAIVAQLKPGKTSNFPEQLRQSKASLADSPLWENSCDLPLGRREPVVAAKARGHRP